MKRLLSAANWISLLVCFSRAFVPGSVSSRGVHYSTRSGCYCRYNNSPNLRPTSSLLSSSSSIGGEQAADIGIVAPLTYVRGCPIVSLEFGQNFVLDFVLSTGSNVNTINPEIVQALSFPIEAPFTQVPVVACGMGTYFDGDSILLGDASLSSTAATTTKPMSLQDMYAVALPLEPAGHGQLGVPFFFRFAAVEFAWHGLTTNTAPTLALYLQDIPLDADPSLVKVPIERLPAQIALVETVLPGDRSSRSSGSRPYKAILATCSPVTILSPAAAAGIALSEDVFTVNALDGSRQVQLRRSKAPVAVSTVIRPMNEYDTTTSSSSSLFDLGETYIYVGELPGFNEFLSEADMVLGTDLLRNTFRMVLTEDAVYFEAMNGRMPYYEQDA